MESRHSRSFLLNPLNALIVLSLVASLAMWVIVRITGTTTGTVNYLYALFLGFAPVLAGLKGLRVSKHWGGLKSVLGRAIWALSVGLIMWSIGEFIWSYYNIIQNVEAPYPSWADAGYSIGVLFWVISAFFLASFSGVNLMLKRRPRLRLIVPIISVVSVLLSYYLVVTVARKGVITTEDSSLFKVFFDFYYPIADIVSFSVVTVVLIASARYLGGLLRRPVLFVLIGLVFSFLYDLSFSYSTTIETYYNAQLSDIFLLFATGFLSMALVIFGERALSNVTKTTPVASAPAPNQTAAAAGGQGNG